MGCRCVGGVVGVWGVGKGGFMGRGGILHALHATHCSKSSFFVQKFNFDFPRKLSKFLGENVVQLTTLISPEKLSKKFGRKTRKNVGVLSKSNFWTTI